MFPSHNISEIKRWFDGLWLISIQPGDGEKKKSMEGRWRKDRRGADRCAPFPWCWKATSEGGRGDIFFWGGGISSYGDDKECSQHPQASLVEWWGLSLDLSPPMVLSVSQIQNVNWNTERIGNAGAFLKLKVQHSPWLELTCGTAGCSELPQTEGDKNTFLWRQKQRLRKDHIF